MDFHYTDGGRAAAGFKGIAGDCVTRAIAVATEKPYREVYDAINTISKSLQKRQRGGYISRARNGVTRKVSDAYLNSLGWIWVPTMKIGTGCHVHLRDGELPNGRLVVAVSRHMTVVIDGVIHDAHNPSRGGNRCVYGYHYKP